MSAILTREYMTPPETADLCRVEVNTLAVWRIRRFGPKYVKMGGRVLYERSAVLAWIESRTIEPASAAG